MNPIHVEVVKISSRSVLPFLDYDEIMLRRGRSADDVRCQISKIIREIHVKTCRIVLVAVLLAGASAGLSAHTFSLGKLSDGDSVGLSNNNVHGSFTDYVKFKLLDPLSSITGTFTETSISSFLVSLEHKVNGCWDKISPSFTSDYTFTSLQSGKYRFEIDGTGPSHPTPVANGAVT